MKISPSWSDADTVRDLITLSSFTHAPFLSTLVGCEHRQAAPASNIQLDTGCSVCVEHFLCTDQRHLSEQVEGGQPPSQFVLLASCSSHIASPVVLHSKYRYRWHPCIPSATGFQPGTFFHRHNMSTHEVHIWILPCHCPDRCSSSCDHSRHDDPTFLQ